MVYMYVYWNTADERYVGKYANSKLQNASGKPYVITIKDSTSVITPTILLTLDSIPNFNYVFIEQFNRYYFVDNVTSLRNSLWEISLREDVLETYADGIQNLTAFVDRNEYEFNPDIIDEDYAVELGQTVDDDVIDNKVFGGVSESAPYSYVINGYLLGFKAV